MFILANASGDHVGNTNNSNNRDEQEYNHMEDLDIVEVTSVSNNQKPLYDSVVSMFPEMFICGDCGSEMLCKSEVIAHLKSDHASTYQFTCLPCGEYYPNSYLFGEHRLMVHDEALSDDCSICQLSFNGEEMDVHLQECSAAQISTQLKGTRNTHLVAQTFTRHQKRRVKNLTAKKSHMGLKHLKNGKIRSAGNRRRVRNDNVANSSIVFSTSRQMNKNGPIDIDIQVDKDGTFPCLFCDISLFGMTSYELHCLTAHKKHVCTYCARTFVSSRNLWRHMVFHGARPPFRCDICKVNYHKEDSYLKHLQLKHAYD